MSVINHINYHCKTDNDIYYVFTKEALIDTLSDIINSIMVAKVSAERTGYLDVVDDYFLPIFNGIKPERLPSHDRDVLRNMGSKDPEVDLCAMLQILLSKKELLQSETQKMRSAEMLQKTTEKLQESANQIRLQPERITYTVQSGLPNKRKWGLFGAILKGASIIVQILSLLLHRFLVQQILIHYKL